MMKKLLFLLVSASLTTTGVFAQNFADSLRAFPGAEGYGAYVTGGRGGRVIYVTHTLDTADVNAPQYQGSLRQALSTPGIDPITIMFKCGGVIDMKISGNSKGNFKTSRSNMTIAGQTALGDGIVIKGFGIGFSGKNVIIRYMRFRPGDIYSVKGKEQSCLWYENASDFIIDHCSFSWAVEESMTIYDNQRTTVQNCLVSESLYASFHDKGIRGYGAQWGGKTASYHHNMLAHHMSRMPRQNGARSDANGTDNGVCIFDYVNNVHYNWGSDGAFYGGDSRALAGNRVDCNMINNYYIPGPASPTEAGSQYFVSPSDPAAPGQVGKWWLAGNVMWGNAAKTNDNMGQGLKNNTGSKYSASGVFSIPTHAMVIATAAEVARDSVFANVGARLPKRDAIDARVVGEAKDRLAGGEGYHFTGSIVIPPDAEKQKSTRTKGIIDTYMDTKPADADASWDAWASYYAQVDSTHAPLDSDGDGMPDEWEIMQGLDPFKAADGNFCDFNNNYTNLENYLNRGSNNGVLTRKIEQVITWEQGTVAYYGDPNIVLTATVNSSLPITYTTSGGDLENPALHVVNGNELEVLWVGDVTVTATQVGNVEYMSAQPVSKKFTVLDFRPDSTPPPVTGVDQNAQLPVKVYPNPVESQLNLSFEEEGVYDVKLLDMAGVVVYSGRVKGSSHVVDVSSYPSGTYLLSIENAQKKRSVVQIVVK